MEWIKVSDRLPKDYQTGLAYGKVQHYEAPFNKCLIACWYKNDTFVINQEIKNISLHCDSNDVLD